MLFQKVQKMPNCPIDPSKNKSRKNNMKGQWNIKRQPGETRFFVCMNALTCQTMAIQQPHTSTWHDKFVRVKERRGNQ